MGVTRQKENRPGDRVAGPTKKSSLNVPRRARARNTVSTQPIAPHYLGSCLLAPGGCSPPSCCSWDRCRARLPPRRRPPRSYPIRCPSGRRPTPSPIRSWWTSARVDSTIEVQARYATPNNFTGAPLAGLRGQPRLPPPGGGGGPGPGPAPAAERRTGPPRLRRLSARACDRRHGGLGRSGAAAARCWTAGTSPGGAGTTWGWPWT